MNSYTPAYRVLAYLLLVLAALPVCFGLVRLSQISVLALASELKNRSPSASEDPSFILTDNGKQVHRRGKAPFGVWVHASAREWDIATKEAVVLWNSLLGAEMFRYMGLFPELRAYERDEIPILGISDLPVGKAFTHMALHIETGEILVAVVTVPIRASFPLYSITVIMHELGHAIGLAHDPKLPDSLMHPNLELPMLLPTDSDLQALKTIYFPAH